MYILGSENSRKGPKHDEKIKINNEKVWESSLKQTEDKKHDSMNLPDCNHMSSVSNGTYLNELVTILGKYSDEEVYEALKIRNSHKQNFKSKSQHQEEADCVYLNNSELAIKGNNFESVVPSKKVKVQEPLTVLKPPCPVNVSIKGANNYSLQNEGSSMYNGAYQGQQCNWGKSIQNGFMYGQPMGMQAQANQQRVGLQFTNMMPILPKQLRPGEQFKMKRPQLEPPLNYIPSNNRDYFQEVRRVMSL